MINKLIEICFQRRHIVWGVAVIIAIFGYISCTKMTIEAYPELSDVTVYVTTQVPGLAAEEIEVIVEYTVERSPHMETIQVVLDKKLLQATDKAARRTKLNRSALVREALREHLRRLEVRALEERDQAGYSKMPQSLEEVRLWESEAVWPAK